MSRRCKEVNFVLTHYTTMRISYELSQSWESGRYDHRHVIVRFTRAPHTAFTPHSHNTRTRTAHTLAHTHYTHTTLRSKMAKPQSILPPDFKEMVRNFEPIRLGDAKEFASNLTPDQQKHPCCACFKIYCTSVSKCCPKKCCSLSCNILCPCCLWYCIPWLCACKRKSLWASESGCWIWNVGIV